MDWTPYLESIRCDSRYALSRECFAPLDVLDHRPETRPGTPFLLDLRVRTVPEATPEGKERPEQKVERWDVLEGLRRHAAEHVLLVGRPGSGKSTALQRLLLEEAERALSDADARIPVLLELRHYQESILDSLRQVLGEHGLFVDAQRLPEWLRQGRLLLLVDGINELPSDVARRGLAAFRREYRTTTPMIFATRELAVGGDLEIGKRLEMEPLTEPQMQRFVRAYLDTDGDKLLRQLQGRLRELAKVPLLLWMLCSLFRETQERLPENLGLALRQFTSLYDRQIKGNAPVSDESRRWWPRLLQRLAFKMLQGPEPTELHVAIARSQAEDWLTDYLREEQCDQPRSRAMAWLNDLVNHHLLQRSNEDLIEFRHQFIQEYYAAAYLLGRLSKLDDVDLQCDYLNYLKWTEPFILLLGLLENRKQALRIVKLAEAVDWPLAARLAGAVHPDWQAEAIDFIATTPQILEWHQIYLYGQTRSIHAVPALKKVLHHEDATLRRAAAEALGSISCEVAVSALSDALRDEDSGVRRIIVEALRMIGGNVAVSTLVAALNHEDTGLHWCAADALEEIGGETAASALHDFLCLNPGMRVNVPPLPLKLSFGDLQATESFMEYRAAAEAQGKIGDAAVFSALQATLHDDNFFRRWFAIGELGKTGDAQLLSELTSDFRQGVQTETAVYSVITALQQHFKIYRADTFWSQSTEIQPPPAEKIMRTLRVVLASPGDVQPERDILPSVIEELNRNLGAVLNVDLKLYRWETDAYPGFHPEGPQGLIDGILRIDDCDLLIGIFWKRFGTPTHDANSGTEHEFRTAYNAWQDSKEQPRRPAIMVYFKNAPYSPSSPEELDQWRKVLEFQKAFPKQGLWWPFKTTNKFKELVRQHLSGWLRDNLKK